MSISVNWSTIYRGIDTHNVFQESQARLILVIDNRPTDWAKVFVDKKIQGVAPIRVEQVSFEDLAVTATSDGLCQCTVPGQPKERRFQPEFVLIRQKPITDHDRNILLGLTHYLCIHLIFRLQNVRDAVDKLVTLSLQLRTRALGPSPTESDPGTGRQGPIPHRKNNNASQCRQLAQISRLSSNYYLWQSKWCASKS